MRVLWRMASTFFQHLFGTWGEPVGFSIVTSYLWHGMAERFLRFKFETSSNFGMSAITGAIIECNNISFPVFIFHKSLSITYIAISSFSWLMQCCSMVKMSAPILLCLDVTSVSVLLLATYETTAELHTIESRLISSIEIWGVTWGRYMQYELAEKKVCDLHEYFWKQPKTVYSVSGFSSFHIVFKLRLFCNASSTATKAFVSMPEFIGSL